MRDKVTYKEAKKLRDDCAKKMLDMIQKAEDLRDSLKNYYEIMRWTGVDCSEEEYKNLYKGIIYEFEEDDIEKCLDKLIRFCKILK